MSEGSVSRRGRKSWRIKYDIGRDPETGERRIAYATVKGTKAKAERELRRRLTTLDKGMHVDPQALTVANYLDQWLEDVAPHDAPLSSPAARTLSAPASPRAW